MFKLVLEKAEEPEIKLPTSTGSQKKQESSRKTSVSVLISHVVNINRYNLYKQKLIEALNAFNIRGS